MWSESLSCDKNLTGFQLALKSLVFVKFSLSFEHFYELRKWLAVLSVSCSVSELFLTCSFSLQYGSGNLRGYGQSVTKNSTFSYLKTDVWMNKTG